MKTIEYFPMAESLGPLKLPFSEAVRVGSMLYLSGSMGIDETGALLVRVGNRTERLFAGEVQWG